MTIDEIRAVLASIREDLALADPDPLVADALDTLDDLDVKLQADAGVQRFVDERVRERTSPHLRR